MAEGRDGLQHNAHWNFQEWTNFVDRMGLDFTEAGYAQTNASFHLRTPIARHSKGFNHLNISYVSIVCMYFDRGNYKFQGFIFWFCVIEDLAQKIPNFSKISQRNTNLSPFLSKERQNLWGKKQWQTASSNPVSMWAAILSPLGGQYLFSCGFEQKNPFDLLSLHGQSKPAPSRTQLLMVCEQKTRFHGIPVPHWLPM